MHHEQRGEHAHMQYSMRSSSAESLMLRGTPYDSETGTGYWVRYAPDGSTAEGLQYFGPAGQLNIAGPTDMLRLFDLSYLLAPLPFAWSRDDYYHNLLWSKCEGELGGARTVRLEGSPQGTWYFHYPDRTGLPRHAVLYPVTGQIREIYSFIFESLDDPAPGIYLTEMQRLSYRVDSVSVDRFNLSGYKLDPEPSRIPIRQGTRLFDSRSDPEIPIGPDLSRWPESVTRHVALQSTPKEGASAGRRKRMTIAFICAAVLLAARGFLRQKNQR
jgi:hypothetical protein